MQLERKVKWYNPFYWYDIKKDVYKEVKNILIFNKEGVKYQTCKGWFGRGNNDMDFFTIGDKDLIRKLKPDFSLKTCFYTPAERKINVYIPENWFTWQEPQIEFVNYDTASYKDTYIKTTSGIEFLINSEKFITPENQENQDFLDTIYEIVKPMGLTKRDISQCTVLNNKKVILEAIKKYQ